MQCKSLWIKASAKCINININTYMHGQKNTFIVFIICIYFYLICSSIPKRFFQRFIFKNPSFCVTLIYSDWSDNPVCCDWSTGCSACRKGNAHQHYWIMAYQVYAVSEQTTWFQFCLINSSTSPTRKRPELLMNPALYAFKLL